MNIAKDESTDRSFKGRREDLRLLTGKGQFAADYNVPDQLYAYFVRSDHAHAVISSIDVAAAVKMPGVKAVLTGSDAVAAGFKSAPAIVHYPGKDGMKVRVPHRHVLAKDRVHYVGQEIALIVAESIEQAQDASESVRIVYADLLPIMSVESALSISAPQIHSEVPGNLCFDFEYGDSDMTSRALKQSAHVTRLTLQANRLIGNPMEPKACIVWFNASSGTYDVYTCTQGTPLTLASLCGVTGVPANHIRIHTKDVGGGFGVRSEGYTEYCSLMLAAKIVGRPIKWVSSRSECFISDHHGRIASLFGELSLDRDGAFLSLRVDWTVDMGAYLSQPGPLINTRPPSSHVTGPYRIPVVYGRHRLVLTNTTPTTAYRGAARPNVSYLLERLVDQAARELNLDRGELRRRNVIPKTAFPYAAPVSTYDSSDPLGFLDRALDYASWKDFEDRRAAALTRGRLRGIGLGVFIEPSGGGAPQEQVALKFGSSGEIDLHAACGPSGQGHETVFPEIIGRVLEISAESITLKTGDPNGPPLKGGGTIASRSLISVGNAAQAAAKLALQKGMELAAREMEVSTEDVQYTKGQFRVVGTDRVISLRDLVVKYNGGLDSLGETQPAISFSGGAHVAEVEIDPETGGTEILRYVAVDDCGNVQNHVIVDGQLHGGITQGIGQVIGEHGIYDLHTGQILTASFMDYSLPRAHDLPNFELHDHPVPTPNNPLGVKGAGESGVTGAVPTLANAVLDALRPAGVVHLDLPCTPYRIWDALRLAREGVVEPFFREIK